jgi:hypothetical protein
MESTRFVNWLTQRRFPYSAHASFSLPAVRVNPLRCFISPITPITPLYSPLNLRGDEVGL